ncbi:hypothetical protein [Bradyrhizobium sp.]|jgi:hypothetical protein|uniref:hypothetical protein n=1 Tax=Bradyrhizobium sp. TaxID=376 RepID=UPI003C20FD7E
MRRQILAGAAALILATAMTSGATASDHRGAGGHHRRHGHRVVGVYEGQDAGTYSGGHYTSLGPLGFTLGPPPGRGTCGPNCVTGSSVSAWSY